jgi:hypothetical protein
LTYFVQLRIARFATLEAMQVGGQLLHCLIAVFWTVGYCSVDDRFQISGDGRIRRLPQRYGVAEGNLIADFPAVFAVTGWRQRQQLVRKWLPANRCR